MSDDLATTPRPHVRAGSITWGLIVIVTASLALWVAVDDGRRDAVIDWMLALTPGTAALVGALALGGILLIGGVLAAIRHAQRDR